LAKKLGWNYLDSGTLYRTLAFIANQQNPPVTQPYDLSQLATQLRLSFITEKDVKIIWNHKDITPEIRTEECAKYASQLAIYPEVRKALLDCQRHFRKPPGLIADGRDLGSTVFPDAVLKIFLHASAKTRAHRRYLQLKAQGINVSLSELYTILQQRDERDRTRATAALKPASDAWVIDTTHLTIEQLWATVRTKVQEQYTVRELY
jgi:cytidylate kinase